MERLNEIDYEEFSGLPDQITFEEVDAIESWDEHFDQIADIEQFVDMITSHTRIDDLMHYDIENYMTKNVDVKNKSNDDVLEFSDGVIDGYNSVIGIISAVHMMRMGTKDIDDLFFEALKAHGTIPIIKEPELSEAKIFLDREAAYENNQIESGTHNKTMAQITVNEYLYQSPILKNFLEYIEETSKREYKKLGHNERSTTSTSQGFRYGINNALKMYLFSYNFQLRN